MHPFIAVPSSLSSATQYLIFPVFKETVEGPVFFRQLLPALFLVEIGLISFPNAHQQYILPLYFFAVATSPHLAER